MKKCVYRGEELEERIEDRSLFSCQLFGECVATGETSEAASCQYCRQSLALDAPDFAKRWVDPLVIVDRRREKTDALRGMLAGASVFLVCGGPSADPCLERLNCRGCFSLAVNNAAGYKVRPQAFVCSDPPLKFSHSIWMDPGIMKFVPTAKMRRRRAKLRRKIGKEFKPMKKKVPNCPNVWGFKRLSELVPDDSFFLNDGACWGNHQNGVEKTGEPKTVCTMLLGMRILRYLGAGKCYLVGVDFRMEPGYGYSFQMQKRSGGAAGSNNRQFGVVNGWLSELQKQGAFEKFGMPVFNTFERSGLRAFPYVPFDDAIIEAMGIVEETPDLSSWYEKTDKEKP